MASSSYVCVEKFPKVLAHSKYCQPWSLKEGTAFKAAPSQVPQVWLVPNEKSVAALGVKFARLANPGTKNREGRRRLELSILLLSTLCMPFFSFTG